MITYLLGVCPDELKGARQLIRGPAYSGMNGWIWCFFESSSPHPGGWFAPKRTCKRRELPRWARKQAAYARIIGAVVGGKK